MATQASKSGPRRTQDGLSWGYCHRLDAEKKKQRSFHYSADHCQISEMLRHWSKSWKDKDRPLTKGGHGAGDAECPWVPPSLERNEKLLRDWKNPENTTRDKKKNTKNIPWRWHEGAADNGSKKNGKKLGFSGLASAGSWKKPEKAVRDNGGSKSELIITDHWFFIIFLWWLNTSWFLFSTEILSDIRFPCSALCAKRAAGNVLGTALSYSTIQWAPLSQRERRVGTRQMFWYLVSLVRSSTVGGNLTILNH